MGKRIVIIIVASLLICAGYYFYLKSTDKQSTGPASVEESLEGAEGPLRKLEDEVSNKPDIGNIAFELTDQNGNKFNSSQLKGKKQIVFFGFTNCPSVCPVSMAVISEVMNQLDAEGVKDVTPVFISVDPDRDTPDVIKKFLGDYHSAFIGLTGSKEQITEIKKGYKIYAEKAATNEHEAHGADYLMDHSDLIYYFDKDGRYVHHFNRDHAPEDIVEYITTK